MANLWVDIYDASGALLGEGPVTNVLGASVSNVLDGGGEISLTLSAADKRVQDLIANERRAVLSVGQPVRSSVLTVYAGSGSTDLAIGTSVTGTQSYDAQSFKMTQDGYITEWHVLFGASTGSPVGTVTWELRMNGAGGTPTGEILESGTFTPTASAWKTIASTGVAFLEKGNTYWFVLRSTSAQANGKFWTVRVTSPTYADGQVAYYIVSTATWTLFAADMALYMTQRSQPTTVTEVRVLGRGIIRQVQGNGSDLRLTLSGPNQLDELRNVNTLLYRVYDGASVAATVAALVALASGWTIDTTGVTGTLFARFDGASVLKALQEVGKFKGYHFRLNGDKALVFGALGTDNGLRVIQSGHSILPSLETNADVLLINTLTWLYSSEAIANWIVPIGAGEGEAALTLQNSARGGLTSTFSYGRDNQDTTVQINGQAGAGATTTITASGSARVIGNSSSTHYWQAQSFQVTAGQLSQITVKFGASTGSPTGTVVWQVRTELAGTPMGTVLAGGNFTPTASATNTITVTGGPFLSANTTYWLLLRPITPQATNKYWTIQTQTPGVYANGTLSQSDNSGTTWTNQNEDVESSFTTAAVTAKTKLAQSFVADGNPIPKADLWLRRVGTPTGNLTLTLEVDSPAGPGGNLVTNGNFASGEADWLFFDAGIVHGVFGATLHAYRNGGTAATFYQNLNYIPHMGDTLAVSFSVANTSGVAKTIEVALHPLANDFIISQSYVIAAGAGATTKTMTGTATASGIDLYFNMYILSDDNQDGLVFDDISVIATPQYNTSGAVSSSILATESGRTTFCFEGEAAISDTQVLWAVLTTDGAQSNTDYVEWGADSSAPGFADGIMKSYAGSWIAESKDAIFDIFTRTTHTDPYDLRVKAGADGRAVYYLADDTSIAAYGQIERVFTSTIGALSNSTVDLTNAADALYDAAAVYLQRYGTKQTTYGLSVRKDYITVWPGDKIRLVYKGYVYDTDGNLITWLDVDALFWVTKVTERWGADGITVDLEISDLDRAREDISALIVGTMEAVSLKNVQVQPYPAVLTYVYTDTIQEVINTGSPYGTWAFGKTARFVIDVDDTIQELIKVKIKVRTHPLSTPYFNYYDAAGMTERAYYGVLESANYPANISMLFNSVDISTAFDGPWMVEDHQNATWEAEFDLTDLIKTAGTYGTHTLEFTCAARTGTGTYSDTTHVAGYPSGTYGGGSAGVVELTVVVHCTTQAIKV